MASLTHVCMWSENGWKPINAEQAARLHPGGTVSARSGLFMCEYCGQYVTLTDGPIRVRYFKHSAYEESKDCPERKFGSGYQMPYDAKNHQLPIRITDVSDNGFSFEVGLIHAPVKSIPNNLNIRITAGRLKRKRYVFAGNQINDKGVTYLPIGDRPSDSYSVQIENGENAFFVLQPEMFQGMNESGTLFEKESGEMLTRDADVEIKKEYYLLRRGYVSECRHRGLLVKKIAQKRFDFETWNLYLVKASEFNENAAKFFLTYRCRLTESPAKLQPVWPPYILGNQIVVHNQDNMVMLARGNVTKLRTFPEAPIRSFPRKAAAEKVFEVMCSERQQLISIGRTNILKYTYMWKEPLSQTGVLPDIMVTDVNNVKIKSGIARNLPQDRTLRFTTSFDGEIVVYKGEFLSFKKKIKADKRVLLRNVAYGYEIQLVVGRDVVWQIYYEENAHEKDFESDNELNSEEAILKQLVLNSGFLIPVPNSLKNIMLKMNRYPRISKWIKKCIREGKINEHSYRLLQSLYIEMNDL